MVLDLGVLQSCYKSRPWLSLPWSGLNFCKQRLTYGRDIFFNFICLRLKNKYVEHLPKLGFGYIYVVARYSIEKQHFFQS